MTDLALSTHLARGSVVAGAVQVFTRKGFSATRVEDILEAAGIARRTFYKYFSSKEDVLAAVYEVATGELLKAVRVAGPANEAPLVRIRRVLDVYLDYHVENAPLLKVLIEQAIRSDSPLAAARRRFRDELVALIGDAVRASTGKTHDPMLYAALISALEGTSLDLLAHNVGEPAAGPRGGGSEVLSRDVKRAKRVMHLLLTRVLEGDDGM